MKDIKFQQKQVEKLRTSETYSDAALYTILLDLVQGNGMDDVVTTLHSLAFDLDRREELEELFDLTKNYEWS
jgi:hypothetical protein